jgi:hypothetical protein
MLRCRESGFETRFLNFLTNAGIGAESLGRIPSARNWISRMAKVWEDAVSLDSKDSGSLSRLISAR